MTTRYLKVSVDGLNIFYREAGPVDAPVLLLLHGFPTAGHMFRNLIPMLSDRFRLIAPDLPGFGQSDMPPRDKFTYTFARLAEIIERFTEVMGIARFAIYVFDYGAPTGFRMAVRHPERITAIISQNGNAYEEGLSDGWDPVRAYWRAAVEACGRGPLLRLQVVDLIGALSEAVVLALLIPLVRVLAGAGATTVPVVHWRMTAAVSTVALVAAVAVRALTQWWSTVVAGRIKLATTTHLRLRALDDVLRADWTHLARQRRSDIVQATTTEETDA